MLGRIHWLGHASFRINGPPHESGPVIYVDPWRVPDDSPNADLILVSNDHHDHCSPEDIERIYGGKTLIMGSERVARRLAFPVRVLREWQGASSLCGGASVRAVTAYTPEYAYHDRSFGGLGFLISVSRLDIYYAGDTGLIPEMDKIRCDIALLPVGGSYTMGIDEAVEAVGRIQPRFAIPMHYGREIPGSKANGRYFVQAVNGAAQAVELPIENAHIYA